MAFWSNTPSGVTAFFAPEGSCDKKSIDSDWWGPLRYPFSSEQKTVIKHKIFNRSLPSPCLLSESLIDLKSLPHCHGSLESQASRVCCCQSNCIVERPPHQPAPGLDLGFCTEGRGSIAKYSFYLQQLRSCKHCNTVIDLPTLYTGCP